jgi:hypothetical protein
MLMAISVLARITIGIHNLRDIYTLRGIFAENLVENHVPKQELGNEILSRTAFPNSVWERGSLRIVNGG